MGEEDTRPRIWPGRPWRRSIGHRWRDRNELAGVCARRSKIERTNHTSQPANSGFGAGPGEVRGFAVTPQSVPAECLADNNSWLTGVIINASQQGGASNMPIERVEILDSSFNGPPGSTVIASGPGGTIAGVPPFPAFVEDRLPIDVTSWDWDLDDNGQHDNWLALVAILDGDATPGQFLPFSTNGGPVPCHTGLDGSPIDEPCTNGDPNFRSMGIGVEIAAGIAQITGLGAAPPLQVRTNNPDVDPASDLDFIWDEGVGSGTPVLDIDLMKIFDEPGALICSFPNVPPRSSRSCHLTPAQIEQFHFGELELELVDNSNVVRSEIFPANLFIFADGFESGDTSSWSTTVP